MVFFQALITPMNITGQLLINLKTCYVQAIITSSETDVWFLSAKVLQNQKLTVQEMDIKMI